MSGSSLPSVKTARHESGSFTMLLHLFALSTMALAQPLYALISANATFLVAHDSSPADILLFVLVSSFVIPLVLFLPVVLLKTIHGLAGDSLFVGLLYILTSLAILPLVNRLVSLHPVVNILLSALSALVCIRLYVRLTQIRRYLSILGVISLVFPLWFLFGTPVSALLFNAVNEEKQEGFSSNNGTSVVLIIFDELPLTSLMNTEYGIDRDKFPNFAALADTSHWFRNASTVADSTEIAVPAILTGKYPVFTSGTGGAPKAPLPVAEFYPDNLFTLLDDTHRISAYESITNINVSDDSEEPVYGESVLNRHWLLWLDSGIVWLNITLPDNLLSGLPDIEGRWRDFAGITAASSTPSANLSFPYRSQRINHAIDFIDSIKPHHSPAFYYLHPLLPHVPFVFLPSGKYYGLQTELPHGMGRGFWGADSWEATQGYQRHLLQLGFVDKLLGEIIDTLKEQEVFEHSLVIVSADHGESFRENTRPRRFSLENARDTLPVPLFVKLPGQSTAQVNDRVVETVDIAPTVAALLEADGIWEFDGRNLFDDANSKTERIARKAYFRTGNSRAFPATIPGVDESLNRKADLFGEGDPEQLFRTGPYKELPGRSTSDLAVSSARAMQINIENFARYRLVDHASGFLPAHLKGQLVGPVENSRVLAIAINGRVEAMTRTYSTRGSGGFFTAMLPESSLLDGPNTVNVFRVAEEEEGIVLHRTFIDRQELSVPLNTRFSFSIDEFPGQYVVSGLGKPEATLTWSTDNEVYFEFMLEEVETDILVDLKVHPFLQDGLVPEQNVSISINREEIAQWQFIDKEASRRQLRIPADLINPAEPFIMSFHVPDAAIPAELGTGPDTRLLGLAFISMTFSVE